jgi:hypothetical protein
MPSTIKHKPEKPLNKTWSIDRITLDAAEASGDCGIINMARKQVQFWNWLFDNSQKSEEAK